jgi:hypothetical protein
MTVAPSDSPFPGWEEFLSLLIHPVKVAAVEALLYFGEPLSINQLTLLFRGKGEWFADSTIRYHLSQLVEIGVLENVPPGPSSEKSPKGKFFYFAAQTSDHVLLTDG